MSHTTIWLLAQEGLLVLTGSDAARNPAPFMLSYVMCKAAVHSLVMNLAAHDSGLPDGTQVAGILPITIDTPSNRYGSS